MNIHNLGSGISLRREHYSDILERHNEIDFVEIIAENFMSYGGAVQEMIEDLSKKLPIISHGVGLSLGDSQELNQEYLIELKKLLNRIDAPWFSDHLCFTKTKAHNFHELLPVLRTKEVLLKTVDKIKYLQDTIGRPFAIENISYYMDGEYHDYSEIDFLNEVIERSNSYLLLDINNVYVNAKNGMFSEREFIKNIPHHRVLEIHLAGFQTLDSGVLLDTHGAKPNSEVLDLYSYYLQTHSPLSRSTLLEWDNDVPSFETLLSELKKIELIKAKEEV